MRGGISLAVLMGLVLAWSATGCANYNNRVYRDGANAVYQDPPDHRYVLHFVEADDEGWFWQPDQVRAATERVRDSARLVDTFVVVFVHGWHHSAECCDDNVEGFKETLARLHEQLAKLRPAPASFALIGIYVGWRARSLPGDLDYFTFWSRKSAAERTGESDLREFLERMNDLYRDHNSRAALGGASEPKTYLGMVTVGHSFGGDVVLRAATAAVEEELQRLNPVAGYLHRPIPASPRPAPRPVHAFGDIVVLVNPAVEADAYQRLNILSRGLTYSSDQSPVMLTVSADNDWPRRTAFRWGRILGEWFEHRPYNADPTEREIERQALGVFGPNGVQVTHRLKPVEQGLKLELARLSHTPEAFCTQRTCLCEWYRWPRSHSATAADTLSWVGMTSASSDHPSTAQQLLMAHDFSASNTFGEVVLEAETGAIAYQPLIVASASSAVVDGHTGIFTEPFIDFLTRYVGFIEGKQYLLRNRAWAVPLER